MARLTLSPRDVVCARLHLLEDSLRLDITSRRSRNLRLLLRLLQSDLMYADEGFRQAVGDHGAGTRITPTTTADWIGSKHGKGS